MRRVACLLASVVGFVAPGCAGGGEADAPAGEGVEPKAVLAPARAHVGERDAQRTTQDVEVEGDRATVTITFHSMRDDSVRDERRVLELERGDDGGWRVIDDEATYRCWPRRGHQDFSAELCR